MQGLYEPIPNAPNFTLAELCRSATAYNRGISNTPPAEYQNNLVYLAQTVLQPIRDFFGEPLVVTSGYRGPALNRAVGGSPSSFHCIGCAADIQFGKNSKHNLLELFDYIHGHLPYTELIAEEFPSGWVHVAIEKGRENEKQVKYKLRGGIVRRASYTEVMRVIG